jgi:uroporphyrinogen III methyltransferase/synthase
MEEGRPLAGKRVLVTRPRHQAADMVARLEELGATVYLLPTVEVREPADWAPVDRALADLGRYQWLVFTSVNGVEFLLRRLAQTAGDTQSLRRLHLAAIGPVTADALRRHGLEPALVPTAHDSEGFVSALKGRVAGQRVLLARADRGRELLLAELAAIAEVEQVAVYSQVDVPQLSGEGLTALQEGRIDFITLTSSNIPRALVRGLDSATLARLRAGSPRLVSISHVTSDALRELGLPVAAEAREATTAGVIEALRESVR